MDRTTKIKILEEYGAIDHEKQKSCKWFGSKKCPVNCEADCDSCDIYVNESDGEINEQNENRLL